MEDQSIMLYEIWILDKTNKTLDKKFSNLYLCTQIVLSSLAILNTYVKKYFFQFFHKYHIYTSFLRSADIRKVENHIKKILFFLFVSYV